MAAAASDQNSFLVMGHGIEIETEYKDRPILPAGYTLVLMAECGMITTDATVYPFIEAFSNPDLQAGLSTADPKVLTKIQGGKTVHILRPGQRYPRLLAQMFLDKSTPDDDTQIQLMKSGLYKYPITIDEWRLTPTNVDDIYFKTIPIEPGFFTSLTETATNIVPTFYKDSIYPTDNVVKETIDPANTNSFLYLIKEQLTIPLELLFEKGGPGVYYWPICRQIKEHRSIRSFLLGANDALPNARIQEYKDRGFENRNWIEEGTSRNLATMLRENKNRAGVPSWYKPELNAMLKQVEEGGAMIRRVRAASKNAANLEGGGRRKKTRRRKNRHHSKTMKRLRHSR